MQPILAKLMANKHTTGAGAAYCLAYILEHVGPAWFPAKKDAFITTADAVKNLSVIYGFATAGDANKGASGDGSTQTEQPKGNGIVKTIIIIIAIAGAMVAVKSHAALQPLPPLPADDPHLTIGQNIERQAQYVTDHPIELARAGSPISVNATSNGVTISTPGGDIPAPPLTNSYSSSSIIVDAGVLTLGVGSTVRVSSYLQGFYCINSTFEAGVITEWGALNVLNAASAAVHVRKVFNDNFEGYAGPQVGWDFANRGIRGGLDVGVRYVPLGQAIPNLAVNVEFDALYQSGVSGIPTGWKAGLSYRW